jgi:conjugative relaxase-like TrwC/TraI family protein
MVMSYSKGRVNAHGYYLEELSAEGALESEVLMPPSWAVAGPMDLEQGRSFLGLGPAGPWQHGDDKVFERLVRGWDPAGLAPLVRNYAHERRLALHDFTLSAPKAVSVLWGLAEARTSKEIAALQAHAARSALGVLAQGAISRQGRAGCVKRPARLIAVLFHHGTSRALDPQLHTHVVVINLAEREDGTFGALETREMMGLQGLAAMAYHLDMAYGCASMGLNVEPTHNGHVFNVLDVSDNVCNMFSTRRRDVEQVLDARSTFRSHVGHIPVTTRKQVQLAVWKSRPAKRLVPIAQLRKFWRDRVESEGLRWHMPETCMALAEAQAPKPNDQLTTQVNRYFENLWNTCTGWTPTQLRVAVCSSLMGLCDAEQALEVADRFVVRQPMRPEDLSHQGCLA